MAERTDEGIIIDSVDFVTIKQTETILMQMKKSICKIKGKLIGTGFFCHMNYENKEIPCLMTNYHVLDNDYIKKNNNKIKISMNDDDINEEITINKDDLIYLSIENKYDLIIIKLKEGEEYIKNINFLELDDKLFNKNSKNEYESMYILHYQNSQSAAVSYGKPIKYDLNYKYDIQHKCDTSPGSSGGPVLNILTNKVIGILKGCIQNKDRIKYSILTFLKDPLEQIKNKDNKDNNINNQINNNNLYNDFNIELKNPIHILNYHTDDVYCLTLLNDGRLVSGSVDGSIIIYNKETFKPELVIKEHNDTVIWITQLSSGILASCSSDKTIKLFNIKGNKYEVLQTLNDHTNIILKIIELKNKTLVSCSWDCSILFYIKDNSKYKKDSQISTNGKCFDIIQTKDNEICYDNGNNTICFYDLLDKKVKFSVSNISMRRMIMMTKDLLLITGENKISIINVNNYKLRIIDVSGAGDIWGVCMLNQNMLLTGDKAKIIRQWKFEDDNLILVSKKEKAHDGWIYTLMNLRNGHIASGSGDETIKIW